MIDSYTPIESERHPILPSPVQFYILFVFVSLFPVRDLFYAVLYLERFGLLFVRVLVMI